MSKAIDAKKTIHMFIKIVLAKCSVGIDENEPARQKMALSDHLSFYCLLLRAQQQVTQKNARTAQQQLKQNLVLHHTVAARITLGTHTKWQIANSRKTYYVLKVFDSGSLKFIYCIFFSCVFV